MKKQILEKLKIKYKDLGFSEKALEGAAEFLASTVKEEGEIDAAVNGVEGLMKSFQSELDKRAKTAADKAAENAATEAAAKTKEGTGAAATDSPKGEEVPAWAKGLADGFKVISDKVLAMESGKTQDSRKNILEAKLNGAPKLYADTIKKNFDRMNFVSDEAFNEFLSEVETGVTEVIKEYSESGLSGIGSPQQGAAGPLAVATKEKVEALADTI